MRKVLAVDATDSRFWDQLLQFVEKGEVIPVLGPDLLTVRIEDRVVSLYPYLARKLAEYLQQPLSSARRPTTIHEVARRHIENRGDPDDLYTDLNTILPKWADIGLPQPLLRLARIRPLKLFITTTFDPILQRALDAARFGGVERTLPLSYVPSKLQDLSGPLDSLPGPIVYHLFGSFSPIPGDYAITDVDAIDFVTSLQSELRNAPNLFAELRRRQVLLIGNNFPDWLARFFLRVTRQESFWQARGVVVAHSRKSAEDASFVSFLKLFSSRTKIFEGGALAFVRELATRWEARQESAGAAPPASSPALPPEMEPGAVFLSYAREDGPFVERLQQELRREGVEVWFDRSDIRPGDPFEEKIKRNITECSVFVPVISRFTLTAKDRFFRVEWDHATKKVAPRHYRSRRFIVPVVIDDTSPDDEKLRGYFDDIDWMRVSPTEPFPALLATLKKLFQDHQKS